jgi:hypothetical protein
MGISYDDFIHQTYRINVLDEFPGSAGKGDLFPIEEARLRVGAILQHLYGLEDVPVILLGHKVAGVFGVKRRFLETEIVDGRTFAVFPHPSGVSHYWNDKDNVQRASCFIRKLLNLGT